MFRIFLFLLTNLAIVIVAGFILNLIGFSGYLERDGTLNLQQLLLFCFIFGMTGSFISLLLSKWMAKKFTGAQVIDKPSSEVEDWLLRTVESLAKDAGIGMPEVAIFPSPQSNAFATGWRRDKALVAVSEGLMRNMGREEIRAVLGHEIGHIANGDMITLALVQGVVNTFVMFFARIIGFFVDRVLLRNERGFGIGYFLTVIFAEIVLGILASMIVFWFSRRREFRADASGAHLAGRGNMISALKVLQAESQSAVRASAMAQMAAQAGGDSARHQGELPNGMKAFGITSGFGSKVARLFSTHPPIDERIRALEDMTESY